MALSKNIDELAEQFRKKTGQYPPGYKPPKTIQPTEGERRASRLQTQTYGDLTKLFPDQDYPGSALARSDSSKVPYYKQIQELNLKKKFPEPTDEVKETEKKAKLIKAKYQIKKYSDLYKGKTKEKAEKTVDYEKQLKKTADDLFDIQNKMTEVDSSSSLGKKYQVLYEKTEQKYNRQQKDFRYKEAAKQAGISVGDLKDKAAKAKSLVEQLYSSGKFTPGTVEFIDGVNQALKPLGMDYEDLIYIENLEKQ